MPSKILTDAQIDELVSLYEVGSSCYDLSKKFQVTNVTVANWLKKRGITMRTPSQARRKLTLNEGAFSELTEEAAYWAGFLMADGCVSLREGHSPVISMGLKPSDLKHLEKFLLFLGSNASITQNRQNGKLISVSTSVTSEKLATDLIHLGITPRKSMTATANEGLVDNPHFWRGVVDGDGSFSTSGMYSEFMVCGSLNLMKQFHSFIVPHAKSKRGLNVTPLRTFFQVSAGGRTADRIIRHLYADATVYLDRKYARAKVVL